MDDELFYKCPRYDKCSVNACKLDSKYPRYTDDADKEKICKLSKSEIKRIRSSC